MFFFVRQRRRRRRRRRSLALFTSWIRASSLVFPFFLLLSRRPRYACFRA